MHFVVPKEHNQSHTKYIYSKTLKKYNCKYASKNICPFLDLLEILIHPNKLPINEVVVLFELERICIFQGSVNEANECIIF